MSPSTLQWEALIPWAARKLAQRGGRFMSIRIFMN
jgi:hypothetical protein